MTLNPASNQRGFSAIEVLAALALFSIVAAGLTTSSIGTIKASGVSRQSTEASALIQDLFEQMRSPLFATADLSAGSHTDVNNPITPLGQAGGTFTRSWTVTRDTPKTGLSEVVATVTWKSPENRSVSGVTYVCQSAICS